jgi:predicted cupin superfamily sugar epimerase
MARVTAGEIIERLGLVPHPEGGHYREIYRSDREVRGYSGEGAALGPVRSALTSIYFLLEAGDFSAFHRVAGDEVWQLIDGGPLELHRITAGGEYVVDRLSVDWADGWGPQAVVRGGELQAARPAAGTDYALCTCLVAPGFDFADFGMPRRGELLEAWPQYREAVLALTRG